MIYKRGAPFVTMGIFGHFESLNFPLGMEGYNFQGNVVSGENRAINGNTYMNIYS